MNGETQLVGLLGWPVAHSKSPAMHNAAFKSLALNWAYVPLGINPKFSFETALKGLLACGFRGANVTVPYKEEAARLVDEISEEARTIGAVNTLIFREDATILGENTDARGFLAHLDEEKVVLKGQTAAIIGAGGAARAIVYALFKAGVSRVLIINRNKARADEIAELPMIEALDWSRDSFVKASKASFIVNTTLLGLSAADEMPWHEDIKFDSSQVVYDAIYAKTPFLKKAINEGARAISGEGMLLWQGAIAFEIWTGVKAPADVMKRVLQHA